MKTKSVYECEICGHTYNTAREAGACEAQGVKGDLAIKVGDIVLARAGFGWFDGDIEWVSNPSVLDHQAHPSINCFGTCCTYAFYYVVTAIDKEGHRPRFHLATKAMGGQGYSCGFTYAFGHFTPEKVVDPPDLQTQDLIGLKATRLL